MCTFIYRYNERAMTMFTPTGRHVIVNGDDSNWSTYLPGDNESMRFSVASTERPRVNVRHVRWRRAPLRRWIARTAAPDRVLRHDAEGIVRPRRQSHAIIARIARDMSASLAPSGGIKRSVVLDNELLNWRIVLAEQGPVQLHYATVADRPVDVNRRVRSVCQRNTNEQSLRCNSLKNNSILNNIDYV